MTSIDSAYKLFTPEELAVLSAKTAEEFKNEVRAAWLRKALEATSMEAAEDTTQEIASLTPKLFSSAKVTDYIERQPRAFAAIFGDQAPQVKQLFNGIAEASTKKTSEMFALAIKGREVNLLTTLLPVGTGVGVFYGGSGDPLTSILSAGASAMAILFTPVVLAQVAKNKKIVNKLITLANKPKENDKLTAERAGVLLNEIILDIADEEKSRIYSRGK